MQNKPQEKHAGVKNQEGDKVENNKLSKKNNLKLRHT